MFLLRIVLDQQCVQIACIRCDVAEPLWQRCDFIAFNRGRAQLKVSVAGVNWTQTEQRSLHVGWKQDVSTCKCTLRRVLEIAKSDCKQRHACLLVRPSVCPRGTVKNIQYNVFQICYEGCKYV